MGFKNYWKIDKGVKYMFDDIDMITRRDSKKLYKKQKELIEKLTKEITPDLILRFALLYTMPPICDNFTALNIMRKFDINEFEYLIIGAHLGSEIYVIDTIKENYYLNILLDKWDSYSRYQKSIIRYLQALYENTLVLIKKGDLKKAMKFVSESIDLCSEYSSNYYLRYLISEDISDKVQACKNVKYVMKEGVSLSMDELISPELYINETIKNVWITYVGYECLCENALCE